ncbi:cytochrome P450 [Aspergillus mulundensis]|uniref:Cytochrome P450 n=1 Tax=Aspergillus mulundensis TaxID=1810919 RepID=A0A3D8RKT6_9EURO|nr:Uncharacterized protein DSM5745_07305 [Aspergillus mulundensis]RDW74643.1 Uncharacterized protein DSM5745_07305 [Aspergillus mulundensis]
MPSTLLLWSLAAIPLYIALVATKYLLLHPLRYIPGPKLWTIFPALRYISWVRGTFDIEMRRFHAQYGPAVRFSRDEVSFITPDAWKDIYGNGSTPQQKHAQLPKVLHSAQSREAVTSADDAEHSRYRRTLSHAFSAKALADQEPLMQSYVDKLISRLRGVAESNRSEDMAKWYNLTTFDLIGDLAFGQSFGGLDSSEYHHWVRTIFDVFKTGPIMFVFDAYPLLKPVVSALVPRRLTEARKKQTEHSRITVQKRLQKGSYNRSDFMDAMLRSRSRGEDDKDAMTKPLTDSEIVANSNILIIAGSETTATLLSGATYWILRTPGVLEKVVREVRKVMVNESDITVLKASADLPYMLACFEEAFRLYPPVPTGLQRWTVEPINISGYEIPPRTKVSVHQSAAYISPLNFHKPNQFIPERWLPAAKEDPSSPFYNDNRAILQPFSVGPRNCLGRNLAFAEMRVILARVLWNFDLELCEESSNWVDQKSYVLWEKPGLMCRLKVRAN